MKNNKTSNNRWFGLAFVGSFLLIAFFAIDVSAQGGPKFYPDDPLWVEADTQDASVAQPWEIDLTYDAAENSFYRPGDKTKDVRALDINSVDEVPNSSWFTNRAGTKPLTPEEVAKGPNTTNGPAPGKWTIIASKSDGISPGFTIKDSAGDVWFIKFDPKGYRAMTTGIEVTITKLFWALGYFVPEDHIGQLRVDNLEIGEGAKFKPPGQDKRQMTLDDIHDMLELVDIEPDGTFRIHASKALEGKVLGGIRMYSTRPDDPNDIFAHEHRRVLRGYGVFAAWFNHVDAKSINAMDTLVAGEGKSFVRHHLIDFSSTVGAGSVYPHEYWEGWEYLFEEPGTIAKGIPTLGFYIRPWRTWPYFSSDAAGRFPLKNDEWDPDVWKPRYSNAAFLRARPDDKFWAARKAMAITDDLIQAAVAEGQFGDPTSEEAIVNFLITRRDSIGRKYLTEINPVVDPAIDGSGKLTFGNAAVTAGFAKAPENYQATWYTFDNSNGTSNRIGGTVGSETSMQAPSGLPTNPGAFIHVEISATAADYPIWATPVHAYFRLDASGWKLVGFERLPEGNAPFSYVKK